MSNGNKSSAEKILEGVGGAGNIKYFTCCATRLRFELNDNSIVDKAALDAIPEVMGCIPQSGERYQIVVGGGVATMHSAIQQLIDEAGSGTTSTTQAKADNASNDDIKASMRSSGVRGKVAWVDGFFEYLSDSFRPILGILLGASLIIALCAVLDALHIVDFRGDKSAGWVFVDSMWHTVFYFLPIMVAYNASKKLKVDPWLGAAIMGALMTPDFQKLTSLASTTSIKDTTLGTVSHVAHVFGLPMQLNDYSGNVFVPLIMVAVLAVVYRFLKKIVPENLHMVFVPFLSLIIMIPLTAFLIGPLGVWIGTYLGLGLAWLNTNAPFVFAILIPLLYPFLVPLGLHWPLNALMLMNIQTLGYDFIQGPMGVWNFACFGATAGVLLISLREKDKTMRQTASGALAAGLFGGISEPSLYGIHLRFKKVYSRMLPGCLAGGLTIAILGSQYGGIKTQAFAFTSLLTIPVFNPMWVYAVSIAVAFIVPMLLIYFFDYRTPEEKAAHKE
ncbi:PTS sugar transporter subunit IIABC [Photobacterium angustum]|uniref:PTS sugar transporter subunit IIABC n=1 Tax=Photobacterium angustum TaxID=661 RepID=A0A855SFR9_PHOAN|nr:PTS transporter subunit EIIC [Photobacterium angustum]KJF81959.1 PTS sugar transporter subunit IIABC [Photobacterium damselae subsp. damselae]KJG33188.1 PTS sugar transporter subunit IIABC [Photobacterium angustum]KJG38068.1 PTS sugar transporter subunit IIABC [Photobacterium angustum]KJG45734.1 PTS sugar transporter subunit IIABC [Photobacterium angustum]KJG49642.1 PTS sugar transporter subunit IIABC [Photobacterium angustum]